MQKNDIEQKYIQIKLKIKDHIAKIKDCVDQIQKSKSEIDQLGQALEHLQKLYLESEKKDESISE